MARQKSYQLLKRGKKGNYSLRVSIGGKDLWRSTGTSDRKEAVKRADAVVESLKSVEVLSHREASVHKVVSSLAEEAVRKATGKDVEKMALRVAHDAWEELQDAYEDLQQPTKDYHRSMFKRFVDWCSETEAVAFVHDVTPEIAKKYANHLFSSGITPKTFNEHIQHLSSVFATLDSIHFLPYRNPFDKHIVKRKRKHDSNVASHVPVDPKDIPNLVALAAESGKDYRDLFILGANTGLRLKDACLLKWSDVEEDFIDVELCKTTKTGNRSRIPLSATLRRMLGARERGEDAFVLPNVAKSYINCASTVRKKTKEVFESFYEKSVTQAPKGAHRKIHSSILSFHSFRVTYMSLLASKDVSMRMAMRIMGWLSPEMIKVYERELEKAKGEADKRSLELISGMDELDMDIPEVVAPLVPTKDSLTRLVNEYSNIAIGKIYGVSEASIRNHLKKHSVVREKHIKSADLGNEDIQALRNGLIST